MVRINKTCKSKEEIDKFVERIQVSTWYNHYEPNLHSHDLSRSGLRQESEMIYSNIYPNRVQTNVMRMRLNKVSTFDNFFFGV